MPDAEQKPKKDKKKSDRPKSTVGQFDKRPDRVLSNKDKPTKRDKWGVDKAGPKIKPEGESDYAKVIYKDDPVELAKRENKRLALGKKKVKGTKDAKKHMDKVRSFKKPSKKSQRRRLGAILDEGFDK